MGSRATGGAVVQVNTFAVGEQSNPTIASLVGGGWVVTWTSEDEDGSLSGVFQQRYDERGIALGPPEQVNTRASGSQSDSVVIGLADGGWVVSWNSVGQVYQQRFDAAGQAAGPEQRVNTFSLFEQDNPEMAALPDGGWVVTWTSYAQDGDQEGIYQQRYDADGLAVGAETRVGFTTENIQSEQSITVLADGGWLVTWQSYNQASADNFDVFQQRYDATGARLGFETLVNSSTTSNQGFPVTTALADGGWIVVWEGPSSIDMQRFDSSGAVIGPETSVPDYSFVIELGGVVALVDGGWVVVWTEIAGAVDRVVQQRFDANGVPVGSETRIDDNGGGQIVADVIATPDGGWTVVWEQFGRDGSDFGIFQRHYAPDILGTAGADSLAGTHWDEALFGYAGDDVLAGGAGRDVLAGGYGDDVYQVNSIDDDVQELIGQGYDTVNSSVSYSIAGDSIEVLNLVGGAEIDGNGNSVANVMNGNGAGNTLIGGGGDDTLDGRGGNDILFGGAGHDVLTGGGGDDRLVGGIGRDTAIYAGAAIGVTVNLGLSESQDTVGSGTDRLIEVENIVGSAFDDALTGTDGDNAIEGGAGNDVLIGLLGIDTVSYASAEGGVTVRLALAGAQNTRAGGSDTLSGFENVLGSAFDDFLWGDNAANVLEGGTGDDSLDGNGGIDTASYASATGRITVDLSLAGAQDTSGAGSDSLSSIENLIGTAFGDLLRGSAGANHLFGGAGIDFLEGGAGADRLIGGDGRDTLTGGAGADRFVFDDGDSGRSALTTDFIVDFDQFGGDRIALNQIDADTAQSGDQAFAFIGTSAFSGTAGELRSEFDGTDTYVQGDTDGDGYADFAIRLNGPQALDGFAFVL